MSTTSLHPQQEADDMRLLDKQHREMADVLEWLANQLADLMSSPLPEGSMAGPHQYSLTATGYRGFIAFVLTAPTAKQAEMFAPAIETPPFIVRGPSQVLFLVDRPDAQGD